MKMEGWFGAKTTYFVVTVQSNSWTFWLLVTHHDWTGFVGTEPGVAIKFRYVSTNSDTRMCSANYILRLRWNCKIYLAFKIGNVCTYILIYGYRHYSTPISNQQSLYCLQRYVLLNRIMIFRMTVELLSSNMCLDNPKRMKCRSDIWSSPTLEGLHSRCVMACHLICLCHGVGRWLADLSLWALYHRCN